MAYTFSFRDLHCPLSNGYLTKFEDENGNVFSSVEQYMMYQKASMFEDNDDIKSEIMSTDDYDTIKGCGRRVANFDPEKWAQEARQIVEKGCTFKFEQNTYIRGILLGTGDKNIEQINPNDAIWSAPGQNLLGMILKSVRDRLWANMLV